MFTAIPYGFTPKFGRFFSAHRLPERPAPARLGFLRRAAAVPGVPRRPVQERRRAAQVGRADRHVPRARRARSATARTSPAPTRNKNGIGNGARVRARRRRLRREQQLARGRSRTCSCGRTTASTRRTTSRATRRSSRFTGKSQLAIADFVWKYAPYGNARDTNFKLQGEYFWREESGDLTYDSDERARPDQHVELLVAAERLVRRGRLPVHAVLARRRALRPARPGQRRLRRQRASTSRRRRSIRSAIR